MPQLTLYCFEGCSYCGRVKEFMKTNKILIPIKDTHNDAVARDELIRIGGKSQVPCLVIDGKALYESLDIIDWLKKHFKK